MVKHHHHHHHLYSTSIHFGIQPWCLYFLDINECASSPCIHGACMESVNGYHCNCSVGFTGSNCETGEECISSIIIKIIKQYKYNFV